MYPADVMVPEHRNDSTIARVGQRRRSPFANHSIAWRRGIPGPENDVHPVLPDYRDARQPVATRTFARAAATERRAAQLPSSARPRGSVGRSYGL